MNPHEKSLKNSPLAFCWIKSLFSRECPEIIWQDLNNGPYFIFEPLYKELSAPATNLCLFPAPLRSLIIFAENGLLHPLDTLLGKSDFSHIARAPLDCLKVKRKSFGLPEDVTPFVFMCNRRIMKKYGFKVPQKWDEFKDQLKFLKEKTGKPAIGIQNIGSSYLAAFFIQLFCSNGVGPFSEKEPYLAEGDKLIEAMEWIKELEEKGYLDTSKIREDSKTPVPYNHFYQETWSYDFGFASILGKWKNHKIKNTLLGDFPKGPHYKIAPILVQGNNHGWAIPANSRFPEEGEKALKKIFGREFLKKNEMDYGHTFPANKDLWQDKDILELHPHYAAAKDLIGDRAGAPFYAGYPGYFLLERTIRHALINKFTPEQWLRSFEKEESYFGPDSVHHPLILKSMNYIESHLEQLKTVTQVAEFINMNPQYFRRTFKKESGISCESFIQKTRMNRARDMLLDPGLSIKEISYQLGFNSPNYFSQVLKQYWGQSASAMRRKIKEDKSKN